MVLDNTFVALSVRDEFLTQRKLLTLEASLAGKKFSLPHFLLEEYGDNETNELKASNEFEVQTQADTN